MIFALFWCINWNNVCFVGIYLTETFKVSQFPLPISREHQMSEQYQGSDDRGELDLKSGLNYPVSVSDFLALNVACSVFRSLISFRKSPWYCLPYYVQAKTTSKKRPIIVDHITFKTIHGVLLFIFILHSKSRGWVINIGFIWIFVILGGGGVLCTIFHWPWW